MNGRHRIQPEAIFALVVVFLLLAAVAGFGGYRVFREQRDDIIEQKRQELTAIADSKVREIAFWRRVRLADARGITDNPLLEDEIAKLSTATPDAATRLKLLAWLESLRRNFDYREAAILDGPGNVLLGSGLAPGGAEAGAAITPWPPADVLLTDIHPHATSGRATIGMYVPLPAPAVAARRLVLYLEIDPSLYLFPLVQSWPTPSTSGETLIVRREGAEVVFLNELRHRSETALRLRLPLESTSLPAARAVRGESGVMEGSDYRGVPVFAVARPVPDTAWFLVAKVDRTEVLDPIQRRGQIIVAFGTLTLLLAMAGVLSLWRQQSLRHVHDELAQAESHGAAMEHAAAALRESEQRYRLLFTQMLDGYALHEMIFDAAGAAVDYRFLDVNPAFERLTGLPAAQVVGHTVRETIPGIEPAWIEVYAQVVRSGEPRHFESHAAPLGRWFEISAFRTEPGRFGTVFTDITERRRAEERLQRNQERLESIVSVAEKPVRDVQELLSIGLEHALALTGSRYGYLYHYNEERREFTLNSWSGAVMPECAVANPQTLYELDKTGIWGEAVRQRRPIVVNDFAAAHPLKKGYPTGHVHLENFLTIPIFSGLEIVAVLGVANGAGAYGDEDIAQLTLLMASVFRMVERRQAVDDLQRTLAELRRSNEELQQFAYIASHDLQEPLRMIASFLQLIERRYADRLDEEGREFIAFAVGGAKRLQKMIDGLLAYSRMERAPAPTSLADTERALARALENLSLQIEEEGAAVTHDQLPAVFVDEGLLVQLFQNLVGNALKFRGPDAPQVHVASVAGPVGWQTFTVSDNGVGFDPQHAERVFGVFRRLHGHKYPGSGIGLALCRRIVEHGGGRIWVETAPDQGARFHFTLPEGPGSAAG